MRAGYATLFGLFIAYAASQGIGSPSPGSSPKESKTFRDSAKVNEAARSGSLPAGVDAFPTISGGICRLTLSGDHTRPCGGCRSICPAKELNDLIEDYFRAEPGKDDEYLATHWYVPHAKQKNIKFVVASLPDPVHTHMALLFDRSIETIQKAAQASGYLFSRAWMPWDISAHIESPDFTVRMAQAEFRTKRESLPGLMIFQQSSDANANILFVFVVGETPTGGLHIEQFQNALSIRQSILADADPGLEEIRKLRIYGPAFSGSLLSLNAVLNAQPHDRFSTILIRSGTISSYEAVHDFCKSTISEWPDSKGKLGHNGRPDFATFQFSDKDQEYYLSIFFRDREHLHSHVAVLSEDETAFGNQERPRKSSRSEQGAEETPDQLCVPEPPGPVFPLVRLYFPREIAQLRDAYQQNVKIQSAADSGKNPPQNGLALSLSVTGNDDDSVAAYAPLQTPLSQESILQEIVAALRKQHAKVVMIRASDPLDMIFLARYLRQNYPQARLVTASADLLMAPDSYDPRFHGILAVTSYPMLTGSQFPTWPSRSDDDNAYRPLHHDEPEKPQHLFADSYSVGDFNALQSLLPDHAEPDPDKLPAAGYEQFGLPSFLGADVGFWRAHLWLTTVGRDGYWPVAVLDDLSPKVRREVAKWTQEEVKEPKSTIRPVSTTTQPASPFSVHFTVSWTIFWLLTLVLTLFVAVLLAFPGALSRSEILGRFNDYHSRPRNCLLFTGSLLLWVAQTLFVFPAVIWFNRFDGMGEEMLCYLVSTLLLAWACYRGFKMRGSGKLAGLGAGICLAASVGTSLSILWRWPGKFDNGLGNFVFRYIHVNSGVSPLLPLLFVLAAWIWWCWQTLTGIVSTEEKHVVLPDASQFDERSVPDASDRVRLKALASHGEWPWTNLSLPFGKKTAIPAVVGIVLIFLLMKPPEIAEAFESTTYKVLYWTLLYSCLLLVCYLVTHIVALWLEFRILLRAIERARFRRGFSDLKSLTWKPLWRLAGSGRQEFVQLLGGELDALTQIQNSGIAVGSGLAMAIDEAKKATEDVSAKYEKLMSGEALRRTMTELQQLFHDLQINLAKTVSEALIYANQQWKNEKYAPPATKSDSAKDSEGKPAVVEPPAKDPTTRAVEHFLCLFYLNVILVPLRRLQTLILAMAGVFVFVLISYSSYPFESKESFHALLISIFFVISLAVGIVYGQMYAEPLLSRITNTKPGELGLDFWVRLGTFVFVPLLSLLSVQFPEINNFLFSWLQPALQSIK
jgi:hypothetical protein